MRVLLTGAGGFSGAHLTRRLLAAGHQVVAVAGRAGRGRLGEGTDDPPALSVLVGDLAGALALPGDIEAVVHAASSSPAPGATSDLVHDNVIATRRLIEHARRAGASRFVYLSSISVFGNIVEPVLDERVPLRSPDLYGATKYLAEAMLAEQAAALPAVCLRLPGVIGPGAARNWLSSIRAAGCEGRPIRYYSGDAAFNNAVHLDDLGSLVLELLRRPLQGFDMVTLGAAGSIAVRRVVDLVIAGTGGRSRAEAAPDDRRTFVISSARAVERYGYDPMDIEAMVRRFAAGG